jgi:hypothetical protein
MGRGEGLVEARGRPRRRSRRGRMQVVTRAEARAKARAEVRCVEARAEYWRGEDRGEGRGEGRAVDRGEVVRGWCRGGSSAEARQWPSRGPRRVEGLRDVQRHNEGLGEGQHKESRFPRREPRRFEAI